MTRHRPRFVLPCALLAAVFGVVACGGSNTPLASCQDTAACDPTGGSGGGGGSSAAGAAGEAPTAGAAGMSEGGAGNEAGAAGAAP